MISSLYSAYQRKFRNPLVAKILSIQASHITQFDCLFRHFLSLYFNPICNPCNRQLVTPSIFRLLLRPLALLRLPPSPRYTHSFHLSSSTVVHPCGSSSSIRYNRARKDCGVNSYCRNAGTCHSHTNIFLVTSPFFVKKGVITKTESINLQNSITGKLNCQVILNFKPQHQNQ